VLGVPLYFWDVDMSGTVGHFWAMGPTRVRGAGTKVWTRMWGRFWGRNGVSGVCSQGSGGPLLDEFWRRRGPMWIWEVDMILRGRVLEEVKIGIRCST
jgi:hypothetical protein